MFSIHFGGGGNEYPFVVSVGKSKDDLSTLDVGLNGCEGVFQHIFDPHCCCQVNYTISIPYEPFHPLFIEDGVVYVVKIRVSQEVLDVLRLSTTVTVSPSDTSRSQRFEPINPAPPVTNMFIYNSSTLLGNSSVIIRFFLKWQGIASYFLSEHKYK